MVDDPTAPSIEPMPAEYAQRFQRYRDDVVARAVEFGFITEKALKGYIACQDEITKTNISHTIYQLMLLGWQASDTLET